MNKASRSNAQAAFESGLSRREFLRRSSAAALIASLMIYKPSVAKPELHGDRKARTNIVFTAAQKATLIAAQMQLFPNDGDGPSANDLNAFTYLDWALTDPGNIEDGDREFIVRGVNALNELSMKEQKLAFQKYSEARQYKLMQQFSETELGENWMSLLTYYLLEALLLDPVYGGNPEGIGWKWLEHQPGYPLPDKAHIYRRYQEA